LRVPAPGGRFDPGLCLLGIGEWIVNSGIIRKRGLRNPLAKHDLGTIRGDIREAGRHEPSPQGPKSIGKVFAARHLSKSGPVSYGFTAFGFEDIMFVDIGVYPHNGERAMNRTLVIKDRDGKWYVHPDPSASPLLSDGLNEEKASVEDLTDVYELEGQEH